MTEETEVILREIEELDAIIEVLETEKVAHEFIAPHEHRRAALLNMLNDIL